MTLRFTSLDVEESVNCSRDVIQVLDGDDADSPVLAALCGSKMPRQMTSRGSWLTVRFITDNSNQRSGFRAEYKEADEGKAVILGFIVAITV